MKPSVFPELGLPDGSHFFLISTQRFSSYYPTGLSLSEWHRLRIQLQGLWSLSGRLETNQFSKQNTLSHLGSPELLFWTSTKKKKILLR